MISNFGVICAQADGQALTLKVQGPSFLGLTRSVSWLLMPWLPLRRQDISSHDIDYVE